MKHTARQRRALRRHATEFENRAAAQPSPHRYRDSGGKWRHFENRAMPETAADDKYLYLRDQPVATPHDDARPDLLLVAGRIANCLRRAWRAVVRFYSQRIDP